MKRKQLPAEALVDLRRRLVNLAPRSAERRVLMLETAALYGISESSLYRALRERARPKALQRADRGGCTWRALKTGGSGALQGTKTT
jgi:hypothetical protein